MKQFYAILLTILLLLMLPAFHATGQIQRGDRVVKPPRTETPKPQNPPKKPKTPKPKTRGRAQFGTQGHKARTVIPSGNDGYRKHRQEEEDEDRSYDVTFKCNIDNATLYIDDYEEEDGPNCTVAFKPGDFKISVEADGYERCDTIIDVDRDGMVFDIVLKEKDRPMPLLIDDLDDDRHLVSQSGKRKSKAQTETPPAPQPEQETVAVVAAQPSVQEVVQEVVNPTTEVATAMPEPSGEDNQNADHKSFLVKGVTFTMVRVEGGTYTRFKIPENVAQYVDGDVYSGVPHAHKVTLSDYYIGMYEVTNELWSVVMDDAVPEFGAQYPYDNANWNQCQEFIARLNEITGMKFRLPTDAEWEFAARGGVKSQGYIFSGSNDINQVGWYSNNSNIEYHNVGTLAPNELGIYDMTGGVPEWVEDWFWYWPGANESNPPLVNPVGEKYKDRRVYRGGGYGNEASDCCVFRYFNDSPDSGRGMGLRLAL